MRDWATGRERWRAVATPAATRNWPDVPVGSHEIDISSDGRNLCIATPAGNRLRLQFWYDGTLTGEWSLPLAELVRWIRPGRVDDIEVTLLVCDGGRSYLTVETRTLGATAVHNRTVLYAFDGSRLAATGCPSYIPVTVQSAPDGRTVMFQYPRVRRAGYGKTSHPGVEYVATVGRVTIKGGKLTYTDTRTLPYYSGLGANETVFTGGNIESLDGTRSWSPGSWQLGDGSENGRYTLLRKENPDRLRVISLDTLRGWETRVKGTIYLSAWPTEDGQACLIRERGTDSGLAELACENLPFLTRYMQGRPDYFSLYRSHGRLIARLPYTNNPPFTLCVSPDGRSILFGSFGKELQLYRY